MGKIAFPYDVTNKLEHYIHLRQANLMEKRGERVTLQEIYDEIAAYTGITSYTASMIKAGSYTPSIILAFLIRDYFRTHGFQVTVDELFDIKPKEVKS